MNYFKKKWSNLAPLFESTWICSVICAIPRNEGKSMIAIVQFCSMVIEISLVIMEKD